jgi:hypothetical protein
VTHPWRGVDLLDEEFDEDAFDATEWIRSQGSIGGGWDGVTYRVTHDTAPKFDLAKPWPEDVAKDAAEEAVRKALRAEAARREKARKLDVEAKKRNERQRLYVEQRLAEDRAMRERLAMVPQFVCELKQNGYYVGALYAINSQWNARFDADFLRKNPVVDAQTQRMFSRIETVKDILGTHGIKVGE